MKSSAPSAGEPTQEDPAITITLPVSMWRIVVAHLERGICAEVYNTLTLIYIQADPQIVESMRAARERAPQAATPAPTPSPEKPAETSGHDDSLTWH